MVKQVMSNAVTVSVRCRPLSPSERDDKSNTCVVSMHDRSTTVVDPNGKLKPHTFSFDHSFWSGNAEDPTFASQERVYESIGRELLRNAFEGFNG